MMSPFSAALLLGGLLGLGLWTLVAAVPRMGAPRLAERIAPYLTDVSEHAHRRTALRISEPLPVLNSVIRPSLDACVSALERVLGGNDSVRLWLGQSGQSKSVRQFRVQQVVWGLAGATLGGIAAILLQGRMPSVTAWALPALAGVAGVVAREAVLRNRARRRVSQICDEAPTVLEFISMTLAAGEGLVDAIRRVSQVGTGGLCAELRTVVIDTSAGTPVADALTACASRVGAPPLTRAVDQMCAAMDKGSPIAEVLRAQATDAREERKRRLLESAGKKEVAMLFPLVLLILPLSIAFALLPGLFVLRAGF